MNLFGPDPEEGTEWTSYVVHWWLGVIAAPRAGKLGLAAFLAVCGHLAEVFSEAFWILFVLWLADMMMGNLRAWRDPDVEWDWARNIDGVIRLIVYGILGVVLLLIESLLSQGGLDASGFFITGGYAVCAIAEVKSLAYHFAYFLDGRSGKLFRRVLTMLGDDPGGDDVNDG